MGPSNPRMPLVQPTISTIFEISVQVPVPSSHRYGLAILVSEFLTSGQFQEVVTGLAISRPVMYENPEYSEEAIYRARTTFASYTDDQLSGYLATIVKKRFRQFGPIEGPEASPLSRPVVSIGEGGKKCLELLEGLLSKIRSNDTIDIEEAIEERTNDTCFIWNLTVRSLLARFSSSPVHHKQDLGEALKLLSQGANVEHVRPAINTPLAACGQLLQHTTQALVKMSHYTVTHRWLEELVEKNGTLLQSGNLREKLDKTQRVISLAPQIELGTTQDQIPVNETRRISVCKELGMDDSESPRQPPDLDSERKSKPPLSADRLRNIKFVSKYQIISNPIKSQPRGKCAADCHEADEAEWSLGYLLVCTRTGTLTLLYLRQHSD
ncbi:hypothetical protein EDB85DRAFT_2277745 [Lactarius pseudohatsudake]|nr:hypothetical protein EDB85DRAFT_2277745 [Lactarius pseudohatsudake]